MDARPKAEHGRLGNLNGRTAYARHDRTGSDELTLGRRPRVAVTRQDLVAPCRLLSQRVRDVIGDDMGRLAGGNLRKLAVAGHPTCGKVLAANTAPQVSMPAP